MRRTTHRLAVLVAALVIGCSPEASNPPPTGKPDLVDVVLRPDSPKGHVGKATRKKKKEPGPGGAMPRSPAVKPTSAL